MAPWFGDEEANAVFQYMKSGGWLTEHKMTKEFENSIATYTGSKFVTAVSNGTVSLFVALLALGVGPGDEVLVPDYTMIATANAVHLTGAKPILVDVEPESLCIDPLAMESAITERTKAVMFTNINGRSPKIFDVLHIAEERKILVIEDAAQSLGSRVGGKHLGTLGKVGSFSFSTPKIITTGQGGALLTDDEELDHRIRMIKDFGRPRGGVDQYEILGYNFKFTDLQAVVGIEQMKKLEARVVRKKAIYRLYEETLKGIDQIQFIPTDLRDVSPWFIDILAERRDQLMAHLKSREIGSRPFYPPIHTQIHYATNAGSFPTATRASKLGLWLPSSSFLSDEQILEVCDEIRKFYLKG